MMVKRLPALEPERADCGRRPEGAGVTVLLPGPFALPGREEAFARELPPYVAGFAALPA